MKIKKLIENFLLDIPQKLSEKRKYQKVIFFEKPTPLLILVFVAISLNNVFGEATLLKEYFKYVILFVNFENSFR